MKIVLATDAWHPQVNGVVRSLATTRKHLLGRGYDVVVLEPGMFRTIPCPTYPEIRLALNCRRAVASMLDRLDPDCVHISTEGPIGWATRRWCLKRGKQFTTAFHTRFPDYVSVRTGIPASWVWKVMRRFHGPAHRIFTATSTLAQELADHGLPQAHHWPRGVDLEQFSANVVPHPDLIDLPRPLLISVGRVAVEKNIEAFLGCSVPGTKVVVGDGPALEKLKRQFPSVKYMGEMHGSELASCYAAADVFVFPSRTDTFGLVNIEALACGVPVAAYPVPGPVDIVGMEGRGMFGGGGRIGELNEDLASAIRLALTSDRQACAREARNYSWDRCTDQFLGGLDFGSHRPDCRKAA